MKSFYSVLTCALLSLSVQAQQAPQPYGALPSERQLKWHEMEMYCLIHFTPTTFQDKEWGYGDADPKIFNPSHFDANQIAQAAASAGFKGLISVAKHHDGFCLWPTKTNSYNISQSPWKQGKGDMVKEFMEAAHQNGLAFGTYLSAWDRNDTRYATDAYTDAYREQLTELMTNYGELFVSWHDGANGGDGYYGGKNEQRKIDPVTYYQWEEKTWPIVRKLQPMASIFSDVGPDMRWVGNEHGFAAETSWATITPKGVNGQKPMPGASTDPSNLPTGDRNGKYWIPAECDVPQRDGWFYHKIHDDKVKTPNELFEIYLKSVGRGANMNLGLAPMPEGILHPNDVKSLKKFGEKITKTFAVNYAKDASLHTSSQRGESKEFAAENILDDDRYSYYAPADGVLNPEITLEFNQEKEFDLIQLRENIKLGQRIDSVQIEALQGGSWNKIATATSIGANRLIKLQTPVQAKAVRIKLFAPVVPTLSDFGLYKEYNEDFQFDSQAAAMLKVPTEKYQIKDVLKTVNDANAQSFINVKAKELIFSIDVPFSGISYLPRQDGKTEGTILKYRVEISDDNKNWKEIKTGEFSNIKANPIEQFILFDSAVQAKYMKLISTESLGQGLSAAEINLLSTAENVK